MKTGECYYRDEEKRLWLSETFVNEEGETSTTLTLVEEVEGNDKEAQPPG